MHSKGIGGAPAARRIAFAVAVTGALTAVAFVQPALSGATATPAHAAAECTNPDGRKLQDQDYDDEQLPWQRRNNEEVGILFETKNVTKEPYLTDLRKAVAEWDRSPCVKPELVHSCPANSRCVTVGLEAESEDGDDDGDFEADEKGGFTTGGHITYYTDSLEDGGPVDTLNTVTHEMGHAIGLRHRLDPDVLMYTETNDATKPDAIDYQNLLVLYGNQATGTRH